MAVDTMQRDLTRLLKLMLYSWLERWVRVEDRKPDEGHTVNSDEIDDWWDHLRSRPNDATALVGNVLPHVVEGVRARLLDKGMLDVDIDPPIEAFSLALRVGAFVTPGQDRDAWLRDVLHSPEPRGRTLKNEWLDEQVGQWPKETAVMNLGRHSPLLTDLSPLSSLPSFRALELAFAVLLTDLSSLAKIQTLEELQIYHCAARDLSPLAALPRLRRAWLDLEFCDLGPLARCPALEVLDVRSPDRVRGAEALTSIPTLKVLKLGRLDGPIDWLKKMTGLRTLHVTSKTLEDLAPLGELRQLRRLKIEAPIEDVGFLRNMTSLVDLDLSGCTKVRDIGVIGALTSLVALDLRKLPIEDISALARLESLETVDVSNTRVKDLSALGALPRLEGLGAKECELRSFDSLASMRSLKQLKASTRRDPDLGAIAKLSQLDGLDLGGTQFLEDIAPLASLTKLTELHLANTLVRDISPLASLTELETVNLHQTRVRSLDALGGLTRLAKVDVSSCQYLQSIKALSRCPRLERVDTRDCSELGMPRNIDQLGGPVTFDIRNHLPKKPPEGWTMPERMPGRMSDSCTIDIADGVVLGLSLLEPSLVAHMARRDRQPIEDAQAKRILEHIRACGPFKPLPLDHPMRGPYPELQGYIAEPQAARRMSWGAYVDRPAKIVVPPTARGDQGADATYHVRNHLPSPLPADWEVVHDGERAARLRTDDARIAVMLMPGGDLEHLVICIYPLDDHDDAWVADDVALRVLGRFRAHGELRETSFGPTAEVPGARFFEGAAWPAEPTSS